MLFLLIIVSFNSFENQAGNFSAKYFYIIKINHVIQWFIVKHRVPMKLREKFVHYPNVHSRHVRHNDGWCFQLVEGTHSQERLLIPFIVKRLDPVRNCFHIWKDLNRFNFVLWCCLQCFYSTGHWEGWSHPEHIIYYLEILQKVFRDFRKSMPLQIWLQYEFIFSSTNKCSIHIADTCLQYSTTYILTNSI